jgi:hypothetical protein
MYAQNEKWISGHVPRIQIIYRYYTKLYAYIIIGHWLKKTHFNHRLDANSPNIIVGPQALPSPYSIDKKTNITYIKFLIIDLILNLEGLAVVKGFKPVKLL